MKNILLVVLISVIKLTCFDDALIFSICSSRGHENYININIRISLNAEPIFVSFTVKLLIGPGKMLNYWGVGDIFTPPQKKN